MTATPRPALPSKASKLPGFGVAARTEAPTADGQGFGPDSDGMGSAWSSPSAPRVQVDNPITRTRPCCIRDVGEWRGISADAWIARFAPITESEARLLDGNR